MGQSGRCSRRRAAIKARSTGRPYHGPKSLNAQANHLRHPRISQQSRATLGQNRLENGKTEAWLALRLGGHIRYLSVILAVYASAAMSAGSSTSAQRRQSIETNPGVCSIRRNQARIAGKVARS